MYVVQSAPRNYLKNPGYFYGIKTLWGLFLPFEYEGREVSHLTFVIFQDQRNLCWKLSSVKTMCSMSSVRFTPSSWVGCSTTKLWKPALHRVLAGACIFSLCKLLKNVPGLSSQQCCRSHLKPLTQQVSSTPFPWNSSEAHTLGSVNILWVWKFHKSVTTKNGLNLLLVQNLKCKWSASKNLP